MSLAWMCDGRIGRSWHDMKDMPRICQRVTKLIFPRKVTYVVIPAFLCAWACLSLDTCLYLSVWLLGKLWLPSCLSVCQSVSLSVCLPVWVTCSHYTWKQESPAFLSVHPPACPSVRLSVCVVGRLAGCLSAWVSVCVSVEVNLMTSVVFQCCEDYKHVHVPDINTITLIL